MGQSSEGRRQHDGGVRLDIGIDGPMHPSIRGRYEWRSPGDFGNQFRVLMYSAVDAPLAGDDSAPGLAF